MALVTTLMLFGAGFLLLFVALHDFAARTIPNAAVLLIAAMGIVLRLLDGQLLSALLAASIVFALAAICWQRGWFGGGDVKLLAATALLVPPNQAANLVLGMALAGGLLSLIYLGLAVLVPAPAASRPPGRLARILRVEQWRISRRGPLPYGAAIAAGAVIVLLRGPL